MGQYFFPNDSHINPHIIWLQSGGRVDKKGGWGTLYRHTHKGTMQLYIVDGIYLNIRIIVDCYCISQTCLICPDRVTGETKAFTSQCKLHKGHDGIRNHGANRIDLVRQRSPSDGSGSELRYWVGFFGVVSLPLKTAFGTIGNCHLRSH